MARTAFSVNVDVSQLEALAKRLDRLTPASVGALMVDAVNEVTDATYLLARKTMLNGINLTDGYVQDRMVVQRATPARPEASIAALGDRANLTGLSHYGAILKTRDAQRARGNPAAGIAPGKKSDGVSVEVLAGKRSSFDRGFFLPGKVDRNGNPIVFARKKATKKIVSRRGPAVYMLFRVAAAEIEDRTYGALGDAVTREAERQFQQGLES